MTLICKAALSLNYQDFAIKLLKKSIKLSLLATKLSRLATHLVGTQSGSMKVNLLLRNMMKKSVYDNKKPGLYEQYRETQIKNGHTKQQQKNPSVTLVNHINSKIQHRFAIIIFLTSRFGSTTSKARKDWPSLKETCYYCCATRLWYCNFLEKSTNQQMRYFLLDIDNIKLCLDTYEYEKESFFKFLVKRSKNVYWLSFYKSFYTKKAKSTKMCLLKQQMSLVIRNSFFAVQTRAF